MEIRPNIIVALGYGKYVRSDKIVGLEPIDEHENRGPRRRTRVFVEDRPEPVIASRTEVTVLRDMVEVPRELVEARGAIELLEDIMQDLSEVGPMLRRSIRDEAGLDIDTIIRRIRGVIGREAED
ncbi:MAG: hypothetical protein ACOX4G_03200 [Limnochordia bacterium]